MIYIIPLLLILLGCFQYDRPKKKEKGMLLWGLIYIVLVLIIGLRYKVGGDTYNYIEFFTWAPEVENWEPFGLSGFEPGFGLLTSLIKTFTDNIYIYQTIISIFMTFMLMLFVKKNTEYKFLAMLLIYVAMYLYFSTEIVRESIAIGVFLLSYHLVEEKKYIKYYLICTILLSIHSSAAFCFLAPLFRIIRFNRRFPIWIIIVIIGGFAMARLMEYLSGYFVFQKLMRYYKQSYVGYMWCGLRFLYFSVLPLCTLIFCKKRLKKHVQYESIICLQIILGFGLWFVPIVFQRLINYTIIFYLVTLADIIGTSLRDRKIASRLTPAKIYNNRIYIKILLVLTLLAHSSYYIHLNFHELFLPYHSMFDPIDEPMREKYVPGQD